MTSSAWDTIYYIPRSRVRRGRHVLNIATEQFGFHEVFFNFDNRFIALTKEFYGVYTYHLFTETKGNSVFCGPETVDVSRGEAEGNIAGRGSAKHTAFPKSQ